MQKVYLKSNKLNINNKIKKYLLMLVLCFLMLILKHNTAFAVEKDTFYIGNKDSAKSTEYTQAQNVNNENIEATLDLSQELDKMIYYIFNYTEYENKTYTGNANLTKIDEKKQNALYLLIHNYKQNEAEFTQKTNNEKLKSILTNYAGTGNNLDDFAGAQKNGAQIVYAQAESWAKGEGVLKTAIQNKLSYALISDKDIKYWQAYKTEPAEGDIYEPQTTEDTLILNVYISKHDKLAQNVIKLTDRAIVEEKKEMLKNKILEGLTKSEVKKEATTEVGDNSVEKITDYPKNGYQGIYYWNYRHNKNNPLSTKKPEAPGGLASPAEYTNGEISYFQPVYIDGSNKWDSSTNIYLDEATYCSTLVSMFASQHAVHSLITYSSNKQENGIQSGQLNLNSVKSDFQDAVRL